MAGVMCACCSFVTCSTMGYPCFRRTLVLEMLEGPWMLGWLWQLGSVFTGSNMKPWFISSISFFSNLLKVWARSWRRDTGYSPWAREVHLRTLCLNTSRQVYIAFQSGRLSSSPKSFRLFNSWTSKQYCVISEQYFLETSSWIFCSSHESCPVTKECFLV